MKADIHNKDFARGLVLKWRLSELENGLLAQSNCERTGNGISIGEAVHYG